MTYPERFSDLPDYAFPRLRALLDGLTPGGAPVQMTIGEPRHAFPQAVTDAIAAHASEFGRYPPNEGTPELLAAIAAWIARRYGAAMDPATQIMVLNGTREGLFNAAIALSPEAKRGRRPAVLVPNPFYQVYAVAALAAGAEPVYVPATAETGYLPDYAALSPDLLDRVTVAYLCSPSNPQGAVASHAYWAELLALAERHDFRVFADECYSEIWRTAPPSGALEVGADPERVVVFHSLSKRSNLPGLRSGFVATGPENMTHLRRLRAYAGAPLPLPLQRGAEVAWSDERHVEDSRARYQAKYAIADEVFAGIDGAGAPEAGFFLWLPVEDGEAATVKLWTETGVRVMPGEYFAREADTGNPGKPYIRVALVTPEDETERGLIKIRDCLYQ
ncbi:MAG: aminotransferase class I/II-fold pyridoxal phosphate-dependent enzyme [Paracoccaceae bacterium]|nr:aminotransferase class I/II-fold pyridoxal phosphate-dependent enzyme [Paracoccaceae bacterium]